ncbi:unnamed protein product [Paramecium sonneborni]|uniref:Uncharacterized protein n=1 Tax=Paramecium sonneborni TaxID=65129 RepID=A0A8S1M169_9CILI|nr:unnamed protein product [Paramecium sonneborni]
MSYICVQQDCNIDKKICLNLDDFEIHTKNNHMIYPLIQLEKQIQNKYHEANLQKQNYLNTSILRMAEQQKQDLSITLNQFTDDLCLNLCKQIQAKINQNFVLPSLSQNFQDQKLVNEYLKLFSMETEKIIIDEQALQIKKFIELWITSLTCTIIGTINAKILEFQDEFFNKFSEFLNQNDEQQNMKLQKNLFEPKIQKEEDNYQTSISHLYKFIQSRQSDQNQMNPSLQNNQKNQIYNNHDQIYECLKYNLSQPLNNLFLEKSFPFEKQFQDVKYDFQLRIENLKDSENKQAKLIQNVHECLQKQQQVREENNLSESFGTSNRQVNLMQLTQYSTQYSDSHIGFSKYFRKANIGIHGFVVAEGDFQLQTQMQIKIKLSEGIQQYELQKANIGIIKEDFERQSIRGNYQEIYYMNSDGQFYKGRKFIKSGGPKLMLYQIYSITLKDRQLSIKNDSNQQEQSIYIDWPIVTDSFLFFADLWNVSLEIVS